MKTIKLINLLFMLNLLFGCTASVTSKYKMKMAENAPSRLKETVLIEAKFSPLEFSKATSSLHGKRTIEYLAENYNKYREVSLLNTTKRVLKGERAFADVISEQSQYEKVKFGKEYNKKLIIKYEEVGRDGSFLNAFLRGLTMGAVSDSQDLEIKITLSILDKEGKSLKRKVYTDQLTEEFRGACSQYGCAQAPVKNFWRIKNKLYEKMLIDFVREYASY